MNKVNFTPKKDIGQHLTNDFNVSIYNELTESKEWQGTFEPLEFFNVFFENLQIINSNIDNLEGFKKHLKGLKFNSKKYFFLISKLCDELYSVVVDMPEYKELMNFYDYLNSQYNEGFAILYPEKVKEQQRESLKWLEEEEKRANDYFAMFTSFDDVEKKLEHIDDNQEKIKYLIKIKSKFLKELRDFSLDERFDEKCQIEINSLRELAKIDSEYNKSKLPKQPQPTKETPAKNESDAEHTEAIKKQFNFFTKDCPRKGKQILNDDDFDKLINWTIYYYENDFKIPEIKEPIKVVNTNMTYVILAFRYLFKELYPLNSYPESLFIFFTKAFKPYSGYKKTNFDKVKNNKFVKELMNINK